MAHRRIRRSTDGYGNVRTGTDLAEGNTGSTGNTATGAAGIRFLWAEFSEAQRREKAHLEYNRKRDQYFYDNFPFYREAVEFAGSHDFKIKPSGKFRGEEFSGYSSLAIFTFFSILKLIQAMKSATRPIMYGRSFFRKSAAV